MHIIVDGGDRLELVADSAVEADRTAVIRAGDLLELEVVAGAAEQRRTRENLLARWAAEGAPVLTKAGAVSLHELRARLLDAEALETAAAQLARDAQQLRTEAEAARSSAGIQEERGAELSARAQEAAAYESQFAGIDPSQLAKRQAELGSGWKPKAEALVATSERTVSMARDQAAQTGTDRTLASYRETEAAKRTTEAHANAGRARASLNLSEWEAAPDPLAAASAATQATIASLLLRQAKAEADLREALSEEALQLKAAQEARDAAQEAHEDLRTSHAERLQALGTARSQFDTANGHMGALRAALAGTDRAGADKRFAAANKALEPYASDPPMPPSAVSDAEEAERSARGAVERALRDLDHADGALTKIGGEPLREQLRREQATLDFVKKREEELVLDSDAWKLLRDALQEAEKEGSAHLGRSLAGPISARLKELTAARYTNVRLDQHLRLEGVDVASVAKVDEVLQALSVGTRDQIATLLRLTIAEQLKSAIVLDDHLVHTDPERLGWFRKVLAETAQQTQVIVITCRADDYLDLSGSMPNADRPHAVDIARAARRFTPIIASSSPSSSSADARRG